MLNTLLAEIKASPRLRIGLALVFSVLWANGLLSLRDLLADAAKRHGQLTAQITRMRQYAKQTDWPERAKEAQMVITAQEVRLWHSGTPGLAQAAFQDWLVQNLKKAVVSRQEATLIQEGSTHKLENGEDIWKIKARLSFDFSAQSFNTWIALLASAERQVVIEKLTVHVEPIPRVEAILAAPFEKTAQ
jgi:hypothetical protein